MFPCELFLLGHQSELVPGVPVSRAATNIGAQQTERQKADWPNWGSPSALFGRTTKEERRKKRAGSDRSIGRCSIQGPPAAASRLSLSLALSNPRDFHDVPRRGSIREIHFARQLFGYRKPLHAA